MPLTILGFKPSKLILVQRFVAKLLLYLFRINGQTRWGNEFIQAIDQTVTINNPIDSNQQLRFRTGHGRLYWRSVEALSIEPETNELIKNMGETDIFYDIGSNVGVYSLMAAQLRSVRTFSFEMELMNCSIQHQNIHLNQLQSLITLIPFALSETRSVRSVYFKDISPGDALHSIDAPSPALDMKRKLKTIGSSILTFSLDEIVESFDLPMPTILKLDVDGVELNILKGAKRCLQMVRKLMVEVDEHSELNIKNYLYSHGFTTFTEYRSHNVKTNNRNILFCK